jgi:hypothetical protein
MADRKKSKAAIQEYRTANQKDKAVYRWTMPSSRSTGPTIRRT